MQKYGISKWPDVDENNKKLADLFSQPVRKLKQEALDKYYDYYNTKCSKSKAMITEAKERIVGGVQHNLALNYPFPIAVRKVDGAYMWDVDDNKYIDFLQAGGPTVLGSNNPVVRNKVIELINECGPSPGLFHEYEYKLADLVHKYVPSVEMFRMLGSGTESCMAAIRIARAYTNHRYVIKSAGGYHGWSDQLLYDIREAGTKNSHAAGIPEACYADTQAVLVNDLDLMRDQMIKNEANGGTACIIVEPLGPEAGARLISEDYNKGLRKLCDEFGALLIFDEVISGFRIGLGCAQGYFDVKPDITVFGKALTGGYPAAGAIGGKKEVMACLTAGLGKAVNNVMVGGTLSANPLSCVAGYYSLLEIEKTDACVKAGKAGDRITTGLNELAKKHGLPFVFFNQGSVVHFDVTGKMSIVYTEENYKELHKKAAERLQQLSEMGMALMAEGIVSIAAQRLYMSLADTDDVIDAALDRFDSIFSNYI